jgi:hypothetical protein
MVDWIILGTVGSALLMVIIAKFFGFRDNIKTRCPDCGHYSRALHRDRYGAFRQCINTKRMNAEGKIICNSVTPDPVWF